MLRVGRIFRDYREARAVNELLAVWGFVDEGVFLTKAGHLGLGYRLRGVDVDGLTHAQRRALVHRMEAGFRFLDERWRVYQHLIKHVPNPFVAPACAEPVAREALARRAAYLNSRRATLYELDTFLILLYEPELRPTPTGQLRRWGQGAVRASWSVRRTGALLEAELDRAIDTLHRKAHGFEAQIAELGPERLTSAEVFRFFRRLVNYDAAPLGATPPTPVTHVDYFVADSPVECRAITSSSGASA